MPVVPFIPAAASLIGGIIGGKKATSSAMKRSPEELRALAGAQGAAGTLMGQSEKLMGAGLPYLRQAGGYYSTLLGGNRAAMTQAVAGPRAALTDVYRGAERNLERSNVRGAARDVAQAELGRERAGQIASLTTGVQPFAAQGLASLGLPLTELGQRGAGQAGSLYGNLLEQGAINRQYARGEGEKAGAGLGGFIFDILKGTLPGGKKGLLPSRDIFNKQTYPLMTPPTMGR
jgi:hypothetical protein